ncbi:NADPH-dependent FMN reductase [Lewinella sp. 4G2]|uniref:NADPH-dependent FMN reductase n=1 Tax=Lewinella sp. 4G2 TaxID=1803372 RepID=UPI0007B46219|nr:NAD(P)H-dependent oxidoreductase [Lewinella sp. 4G2]OAV44729.1 hypothetical protein A3850_009605 [Lewinella sp. 4G2]
MITVISGTNRKDSVTLAYAQHYVEALRAAGEGAQLLDLSEVSLAGLQREMYSPDTMDAAWRTLQETYILGAQKMVFISPEYNGSYPGVLKLFIDGISVNNYKQNFSGKIVALVGISSGRAGNLRGMDHLGDCLAHMGAWVLPNRTPVSLADQHLEDRILTDAPTVEELKKQIQQLITA